MGGVRMGYRFVRALDPLTFTRQSPPRRWRFESMRVAARGTKPERCVVPIDIKVLKVEGC